MLTCLKEGYLLVTHSYGFLTHPYLTLKRLKRDRSQVAIFISLWLGAWLGVFLLLALFWLLGRFLPPVQILAKLGIYGVGFLGAFLLFFTFYLLYWLRMYFKESK